MLRWIKFIGFLLVGLAIFSLFPASVDYAERFIQKFEDKSWAGTAYYQLGNHCYRTLRYGKALEIYEKALRKYPRHPLSSLAMFRVAVCLEKLNRNREAIRAYKRFLKKNPHHYLAPQARNELKRLEELEGK